MELQVNFHGKSLEVYTTIPKYFDTSSVNFDNCVKTGEVAEPFIRKFCCRGTYNLFCRDGNTTNAPLF